MTSDILVQPSPPPDSLGDFLRDIAPIESAYAAKVFSFACRRRDKDLALLVGSLALSGMPSKIKNTLLEAEDIVLGQYDLGVLAMPVAQFLSDIKSKGVSLPLGLLRLHENSPLVFDKYQKHVEVRVGERLDTLTIQGGYPKRRPDVDLDWEFRNGLVPFDGLAEASFEYGLGGIHWTGQLVISARQVLAFNGSSTIKGNKATIDLLLSENASPEKVSIGYRALDGKRAVLKRERIDGASFVWVKKADHIAGSHSWEIPEGVVLHAFGSYDRRGQQRYWIANPEAAHNPQRAAFEVFDPGLSNLKSYLQGEGKKSQNDFETGVSNLLSLLGFRVTSLFGSKHKDAPDTVASVPLTEDIALVECTTDTLKGDNKLGKLLKRVSEVQVRLFSGGSRSARVLPVIVSALPMDQLRADMHEARRLGIVVVDQKMLLDGLERTILTGDPATLYNEAWKSAEDGKKEGQSSGATSTAP